MGSVAPKVDMNDKLKFSAKHLNTSLSILCPAQGYPMPAFRWDAKFMQFSNEQESYVKISYT